MGAALIAVLLRLLAPEPVQGDGVFMTGEVAHAPDRELLPSQTASVAEFLRVDHPLDSVAGPEVFMTGTATQPSRSAAEFLGTPRSEPGWMVHPTAAGPEAFMPSGDAETPRPDVFMPTQSGSSNEPEVFMVTPVPADSSSAVFMSTAR